MKKLLLTVGLTASALCASAFADYAYPLSFTSNFPARNTSGVKVAAQSPTTVVPLADDNTDATPVYDRPEGTSKLYSRDSKSYANASGMVLLTDDRGLAVEIVTAEDGTVWMNNPFSQYNCGAWLKCSIEDDVLTIALPQPIYTGLANGEEFTYYASRLKYDTEKEWFYTTEDQNYTFKIEDNRIIDTTGGDVLGMTRYALDANSAVEKYTYAWTGYGDYYLVMTEHTAEPLEAPEGLDMDSDWALIRYAEGHEINLGFDEEKNVWVQGMLKSLPYAWVKGTPGENSTYEFESEQYLGIDPLTRHFSYFSGGRVEKRFDEQYQADVNVVGVIPSLTMNYYPERKRFLSQNGENMLITTNTIEASQKTGLAYNYLYDEPALIYQDRVPGTPPRPIRVTGYLPYNSQVYYGGISFDLPTVDVDGMMIDPQGLYYEMMVDGELFTFMTDEYLGLSRDLTQIPFYWSDGIDFMCQGVDHILYFFFDGYDSIKIRSIYYEGGEAIPSEWVEVTTFGSGIKSVEANHGEVVSTEYYDMTGMRINNPANTMCIVRTKYADGTVKATKQIFK